MRVLIIEDEPLLAGQLKKMIGEIEPSVETVAIAHTIAESVRLLRQPPQPELILMDIELADGQSFDIFQQVQIDSSVIFITAYDEYAIKAFRLNGIDYLLKPVTYERFCAGIAKFLKTHITAPPPPDYTYFKVDGRMIRLPHCRIRYAQSIRDYMVIVSTDGKYITHMTMKYLAGLLPSTDFKRIHRSFLVGIKHITSISREEVRLGEISIPVGESYRAEVQRIGRGG